MRVHRLAVALVALALALVACEPGPGDGPAATPAPSPTPTAEAPPEEVEGLVVGVVLAPPGHGASVLEDEVRAAGASLARRTHVATVRVLAPPDEDFRADQLLHLVEGGADVVCGVGESSRAALAALASRHPRTSFCLLGGEPEPEEGLLVLSWDEDGLAFLAGAAAAMAGDPEAAVGLVVLAGSPEETRAEAFARGVAEIDEDRAVGILAVEPSDDPQDVRSALEDAITARDEGDEEVGAEEPGEQEQADEEVDPPGEPGPDPAPLDVLVPIGPPRLLLAVAGLAVDRELLVVGGGADLADTVGDDAHDVVVLSIVRRARPALERAVRGITDDEAATDGVVRLPIDATLQVRPGGAEGATGYVERTVALSDRLVDGDIGP